MELKELYGKSVFLSLEDKVIYATNSDGSTNTEGYRLHVYGTLSTKQKDLPLGFLNFDELWHEKTEESSGITTRYLVTMDILIHKDYIKSIKPVES